MATITKGYTFGATEQVTNTKLHSLVDSASITSILHTELSTNILTSLATTNGNIKHYLLSTNILTSLPSAAGKVPTQNLYTFSNVATNATIPDVSGATSFKLFWTSPGSIASITNARVGQSFTFFAGQASFPTFVDTGNFLLSANWTPAKADDNITLLWNGTNFVETSRVSV